MLGSRYVPGGGVTDWGLVRRLVSRGGSAYARLVLGVPVRDLTGGFKCFRRRVLEGLDLDKVHADGYAFQIELTYQRRAGRLQRRGGPDRLPRTGRGESKMTPRDRARGGLEGSFLRFRS